MRLIESTDAYYAQAIVAARHVLASRGRGPIRCIAEEDGHLYVIADHGILELAADGSLTEGAFSSAALLNLKRLKAALEKGDMKAAKELTDRIIRNLAPTTKPTSKKEEAMTTPSIPAFEAITNYLIANARDAIGQNPTLGEVFDQAIGTEPIDEAMWSKDVKTKWTPPEGLFKKGAKEIAKVVAAASESLKQAVSRVNFYLNRAGKNLEPAQVAEVKAAIPLLKKKFEDVLSAATAICERVNLEIPEAIADRFQMDEEGIIVRAGTMYRKSAAMLAKALKAPVLVVAPVAAGVSAGYSGQVIVAQTLFDQWDDARKKLFRVLFNTGESEEASAAESMDEAAYTADESTAKSYRASLVLAQELAKKSGGGTTKFVDAVRHIGGIALDAQNTFEAYHAFLDDYPNDNGDTVRKRWLSLTKAVEKAGPFILSAVKESMDEEHINEGFWPLLGEIGTLARKQGGKFTTAAARLAAVVNSLDTVLTTYRDFLDNYPDDNGQAARDGWLDFTKRTEEAGSVFLSAVKESVDEVAVARGGGKPPVGDFAKKLQEPDDDYADTGDEGDDQEGDEEDGEIDLEDEPEDDFDTDDTADKMNADQGDWDQGDEDEEDTAADESKMAEIDAADWIGVVTNYEDAKAVIAAVRKLGAYAEKRGAAISVYVSVDQKDAVNKALGKFTKTVKWTPSEGTDESMDEAGGDYAGFCQKATDAQLRAIIAKEHKANRRKDRDTAETEAKRRGWDASAIKDARNESAPVVAKHLNDSCTISIRGAKVEELQELAHTFAVEGISEEEGTVTLTLSEDKSELFLRVLARKIGEHPVRHEYAA